MAGEYARWLEHTRLRVTVPEAPPEVGPQALADWVGKMNAAWRSFSPYYLVRWGARYAGATGGRRYRWLSSIFVHGATRGELAASASSRPRAVHPACAREGGLGCHRKCVVSCANASRLCTLRACHACCQRALACQRLPTRAAPRTVIARIPTRRARTPAQHDPLSDSHTATT